MTSILAAATIGAWSYAGFLAEPGPSPPSPAPPSAPAPPSPPPIDPKPPERPGVDEAPAPPPPSFEATSRRPVDTRVPQAGAPAPFVASPAAKPRYRLADAAGQLWEHEDPATLRAYVEARDRAWQSSQVAYSFTFGPSTCASGRCR